MASTANATITNAIQAVLSAKTTMDQEFIREIAESVLAQIGASEGRVVVSRKTPSVTTTTSSTSKARKGPTKYTSFMKIVSAVLRGEEGPDVQIDIIENWTTRGSKSEENWNGYKDAVIDSLGGTEGISFTALISAVKEQTEIHAKIVGIVWGLLSADARNSVTEV
jgi:hypothetical protein